MGICISYQGTMDEPAKLDELIDVYEAMGRVFEWKTGRFEQRLEGGLLRMAGLGGGVSLHLADEPLRETVRGLLLQPPGTETLLLTVDSKGRLIHYQETVPGFLRRMSTMGGRTPSAEEQAMLESLPEVLYIEYEKLWVKTTGEVAQHKRIVRLLRHLQKHYISNLDVQDEAGFWETADEARLKQTHARMAGLIGLLRQPGVMGALAEAAGLEGAEGLEVVEQPPPPPRDKSRDN